MGKKRIDESNWGQFIKATPNSDTAIKQHNVENKYDNYLLPGIDQNAVRARGQGIVGEISNGVGRAVLKVLPNVIGNAAAILDLEDYNNQDDEVGNYVSRTMQSLGEEIDEFMPVYEKSPGEALSFGDSAWWVKNMSQVLGSGLEFAITGAGVAGVVGKGLSLVGATGKAGAAINLGVNALALNQAEALVSAQTVYKNAYEFNKKKGLGDEESKRIAADAASYTININRLNLPLNLTSSALFLKTPIATRQIVDKLNRATTLKRFMGEGTQEFGEEMINHIAESEGDRRGEGKGYNVANTIKDIFSAEGIEAGLLGALGGVAQTGFTEVVNELNGKNKDWRDRYNAQQAIFKEYESLRTSIPGQEKFEKILENTVVQSTLMNKIYEADLSNNESEASRLREELLQYQALNAFKNGTTEQLVGLFDHVINSPDAEAKHGKEYATKVQEAKQNILKWESLYNSYIGKYPDNKVEHIFNNVLEKERVIKNLISNTKKIDELKSKISQNEALGIPSDIEMVQLTPLEAETEALREVAKQNALDFNYINSSEFDEQEYKRNKLGVVEDESENREKVEERVSEAEEVLAESEETEVTGEEEEVSETTVTEDGELSPDETPFDFGEGEGGESVIVDDSPKDHSVNNKKFFDANIGEYNVRYKVKDGKIVVAGAEYSDGRPIKDAKEFDEVLEQGKKELELLNSLSPEEVGKLVDNKKVYPMDSIKKAKAKSSTPVVSKEGISKIVDKILKEIDALIASIGPDLDKAKYKKILNTILKQRDTILAQIDPADLVRIGAASDAAVEAIDKGYSPTSDEAEILDAPPRVKDLFSEEEYKSHTAFRTTSPMYEEAMKAPEKFPEVIRWQNFVNTFTGDFTKFKLKVLTTTHPDYKTYQTEAQKKYEKKTGESGIIVVLTDLDGKPIQSEGHDLTTILLKSEFSDTADGQSYVSKDNMAKHMGIALDNRVAIDKAYAEMWKEQRALREELLKGNIEYLPIDGMGKGVPVRDGSFDHNIVGRAVKNLKDAEFKVGTTDIVDGKVVDTSYYGPQKFSIKSGYLYVIIDGEPVALKPRALNSKDISDIVKALSGLTQDDHVANKRIDAFVKQYMHVNSKFDEKGEPIGGRNSKSFYTRGNTIYFGVDGKIQVKPGQEFGELKRFLTTKYRQVQASKINNKDAKVVDPNGNDVGNYREFLFNGDKPAFTTNLPELGKLKRVNNYFTYSKPKPEPVIPPVKAEEEVKEVPKEEVIIDYGATELGGFDTTDFAFEEDTKDDVVDELPEKEDTFVDVKLEDVMEQPFGFETFGPPPANKPSVFAVQSYINKELSGMVDRFTPDELRDFIKKNDSLTKEQILAAFIQYKKLC
jgi:hypothetical protein